MQILIEGLGKASRNHCSKQRWGWTVKESRERRLHNYPQRVENLQSVFHGRIRHCWWDTLIMEPSLFSISRVAIWQFSACRISNPYFLLTRKYYTFLTFSVLEVKGLLTTSPSNQGSSKLWRWPKDDKPRHFRFQDRPRDHKWSIELGRYTSATNVVWLYFIAKFNRSRVRIARQTSFTSFAKRYSRREGKPIRLR